MERPTDKMLFLLHACYNGGLVYEDEKPLVPMKAAPLQIHVSDLCDNAGNLSTEAVDENLQFATYMADFLAMSNPEQEGVDCRGRNETLRELIRLLRFYDTNSLAVRDELTSRTIAKGIYLSASLFNHSCEPNCVATFEGDILTIRSIGHVKKGSELCLSYIDNAHPRATRQEQLFRRYSFTCKCQRCLSTSAKAFEGLLHGVFCPMQDCRSQLVPTGSNPESAGLASSTLDISSVQLDISFIPSVAGYTGERAGYEFREEGRHGKGYYLKEDEYGYPIFSQGDTHGIHECTGCARTGVDVYVQKALVLTAERHKFYHTHRKPAICHRISAFQTAQQLRQVANLELSCLHPFHPSVCETLRALYRMYSILKRHRREIRVLRVLAIRDELVYGVVAPQTAHTCYLLARSYLDRSSDPVGETYPIEMCQKDAEHASAQAQKALQIMSVIYGRNHEVTIAAHVLVDLAHFRVESIQRDRNVKMTGTTDCTTSKDAVGVERALQCSSCATVFELGKGSRIASCPECGRFCTENESYDGKDAWEDEEEDEPFGNLLACIYDEAQNQEHLAGDMLPCEPLPLVSDMLPSKRALTCSTGFYDSNLREVIDKIQRKHEREWQPCVICSKPRASKQCVNCKARRYCTIECARLDYSSGHKSACKVIISRSTALTFENFA